MKRFSITILNHGFKVKIYFQNDKYIVAEFAARLNEYNNVFNRRTKQIERKFKATYATYCSATLTYGFLKELYTEFISYCKNYYKVKDEDFEITILDVPEGVTGYFQLSSKFNLYEHQVPIANHILEKRKLIILPAQTGLGKTAIALYCVTRLKVRTMITSTARHLGTWLKEIEWMYEQQEDMVLFIKNGKELIKTITLAKENKLTASLLIVSNTTLLNYIKEYELKGNSSYGCLPNELYKVLGVGFRIVDEAREFLHFNVKHTIETHVDKILYLSATIHSNDPFINTIYNYVFPFDCRYKQLTWRKYSIIKAVSYKLTESKEACYNGTRGYSHVLFEQWILKDKVRKNNYVNMILDLLFKIYHKNYQPKQRVLIYTATTELGRFIVERIKIHPVLNKYTTSSFNMEHTDDVLKSFDIIVSTPIKCGSGKDIKHLVMVISTVAVIRKEKIIQMVGRLRDIKKDYPTIDPVYYDLVCSDIPKHLYYLKLKQEIFFNLVKAFQLFKSSYII